MKLTKMLSVYMTGTMIKKNRKIFNGDTYALSLDIEKAVL